MQQDIEIFDYIEEDYTDYILRFRYPRLDWLIFELEYFDLKTGIDFGCDGGWLTLYLASRGYIMQGVDISSESIKKGIERAKLAGLDIDFKVSSIEKCKVNKADFGVLFETIEHVDSPDKVLDKIESFCDYIFISTPNAKKDWKPCKEHLRLYTLEELKSLVSERGNIITAKESDSDNLLYVAYKK